jgi:hypothetical protein
VRAASPESDEHAAAPAAAEIARWFRHGSLRRRGEDQHRQSQATV